MKTDDQKVSSHVMADPGWGIRTNAPYIALVEAAQLIT